MKIQVETVMSRITYQSSNMKSDLYLLTYQDKGKTLWKEKIVVE